MLHVEALLILMIVLLVGVVGVFLDVIGATNFVAGDGVGVIIIVVVLVAVVVVVFGVQVDVVSVIVGIIVGVVVAAVDVSGAADGAAGVADVVFANGIGGTAAGLRHLFRLKFIKRFAVCISCISANILHYKLSNDQPVISHLFTDINDNICFHIRLIRQSRLCEAFISRQKINKRRLVSVPNVP